MTPQELKSFVRDMNAVMVADTKERSVPVQFYANPVDPGFYIFGAFKFIKFTLQTRNKFRYGMIEDLDDEVSEILKRIKKIQKLAIELGFKIE